MATTFRGPAIWARRNGIVAGKVTYIDADGAEHATETGSVVIAVGMNPKNDLALEFYGAGDRFFMIGDCNGVGNVQKVMRSAFSTASLCSDTEYRTKNDGLEVTLAWIV